MSYLFFIFDFSAYISNFVIAFFLMRKIWRGITCCKIDIKYGKKSGRRKISYKYSIGIQLGVARASLKKR